MTSARCIFLTLIKSTKEILGAVFRRTTNKLESKEPFGSRTKSSCSVQKNTVFESITHSAKRFFLLFLLLQTTLE